MNTLIVKNVEIKIGDKMTIYTRRGANVVGEVDEIDGALGLVHVKAMRTSGTAPHGASGWYEPQVSARGIAYAAEE